MLRFVFAAVLAGLVAGPAVANPADPMCKIVSDRLNEVLQEVTLQLAASIFSDNPPPPPGYLEAKTEPLEAYLEAYCRPAK